MYYPLCDWGCFGGISTISYYFKILSTTAQVSSRQSCDDFQTDWRNNDSSWLIHLSIHQIGNWHTGWGVRQAIWSEGDDAPMHHSVDVQQFLPHVSVDGDFMSATLLKIDVQRMPGGLWTTKNVTRIKEHISPQWEWFPGCPGSFPRSRSMTWRNHVNTVNPLKNDTCAGYTTTSTLTEHELA